MRVVDQTPTGRDPRWRMVLGPDPRVPHAARRYVTSALREWGWADERCGVAELLTSEVLTNAFRHADGPAVLSFVISTDHVRVTVEDCSPAEWPSARVPGEDGGWGMTLLDALATGWGFATSDTTKTVWFELDGP